MQLGVWVMKNQESKTNTWINLFNFVSHFILSIDIIRILQKKKIAMIAGDYLIGLNKILVW